MGRRLTHDQAFVGFVEVVGGKSEIDFFAKSYNACAEVDLAHFSAARLVLGLVNEPFAGVNHVAKGQLTPVEGLLEISGFKSGLDGEFRLIAC